MSHQEAEEPVAQAPFQGEEVYEEYVSPRTRRFPSRILHPSLSAVQRRVERVFRDYNRRIRQESRHCQLQK